MPPIIPELMSYCRSSQAGPSVPTSISGMAFVYGVPGTTNAQIFLATDGSRPGYVDPRKCNASHTVG